MTLDEIHKNKPYEATHYMYKYGHVSYYCYVDNTLCLIKNGWELFPCSQDGIKPLY